MLLFIRNNFLVTFYHIDFLFLRNFDVNFKIYLVNWVKSLSELVLFYAVCIFCQSNDRQEENVLFFSFWKFYVELQIFVRKSVWFLNHFTDSWQLRLSPFVRHLSVVEDFMLNSWFLITHIYFYQNESSCALINAPLKSMLLLWIHLFSWGSVLVDCWKLAY